MVKGKIDFCYPHTARSLSSALSSFFCASLLLISRRTPLSERFEQTQFQLEVSQFYNYLSCRRINYTKNDVQFYHFRDNLFYFFLFLSLYKGASIRSPNGEFMMSWMYNGTKLVVNTTCQTTGWCAVGFTTTGDGKGMRDYDIALGGVNNNMATYLYVSEMELVSFKIYIYYIRKAVLSITKKTLDN